MGTIIEQYILCIHLKKTEIPIEYSKLKKRLFCHLIL